MRSEAIANAVRGALMRIEGDRYIEGLSMVAGVVATIRHEERVRLLGVLVARGAAAGDIDIDAALRAERQAQARQEEDASVERRRVAWGELRRLAAEMSIGPDAWHGPYRR